MANRKTRRKMAKELPSGFAITDVREGEELRLYIAAYEGRPLLTVHQGQDLLMAVPALPMIHAIAVMMEEGYKLANKNG